MKDAIYVNTNITTIRTTEIYTDYYQLLCGLYMVLWRAQCTMAEIKFILGLYNVKLNGDYTKILHGFKRM
jgi:hypothetical protein